MSIFLRDACWGAVENSSVTEAGELGITEYLLRTNKAIMYDANETKPET